MHPDPQLPGELSAPDEGLRGGAGVHHRLQGSLGHHEPRGRRLLLRASLRQGADAQEGLVATSQQLELNAGVRKGDEPEAAEGNPGDQAELFRSGA